MSDTILLGGATIYESNDDYTFDGLPYALTLHTHYASVADLLDDFVAGKTVGGNPLLWELTTARCVRFYTAGATVFAVTWDDGALRDLLGFDANLTAAAEYTAATPPPFAFFPGKLCDSIEELAETWEQSSIQAASDSGSVYWVASDQEPRRTARIRTWVTYAAGPSGRAQLLTFLRYAQKGYPFTVYPAWPTTTPRSTSTRSGSFRAALQKGSLTQAAIEWVANAKTDGHITLETWVQFDGGDYA